jgi:Nucleoside diphosphate kinase
VQDEADRILRAVSIDNDANGQRGYSRSSSDALSRGACLIAMMSGPDAMDIMSSLVRGNVNYEDAGVLVTTNGMQVSELADLVFFGPANGRETSKPLPNSSTLDCCTCCVIKPHAVKARTAGKILDMIIQQGYEVSAVATVQFDKTQAEEFLEIYKVGLSNIRYCDCNSH